MTTSENAKKKERITHLYEDYADVLTEWEEKFLKSIFAALDKYDDLTSKQTKVLEDIEARTEERMNKQKE